MKQSLTSYPQVVFFSLFAGAALKQLKTEIKKHVNTKKLFIDILNFNENQESRSERRVHDARPVRFALYFDKEEREMEI